MKRKDFLKALALLPLSSSAAGDVFKALHDIKPPHPMNLNELNKTVQTFGASGRMPVLFIGHGNPMNAVTDNEYSKSWAALGKKISPPKAILCVSAHWLTSGVTAVTMSDPPKTIHDFGGFPDELFKVQYPAPGAVDYAKMAISAIKSTPVHEDFKWGLDHGAWSVLKNMYPRADVPVFQMSIDFAKAPLYHYNLAKELMALRYKGVLIVASGNVVHNLGMVAWGDQGKKFDWAVEFDELVKKSIENNEPDALINYQKLGKIATMAHPTNDHYLPLLYAIGLRDKSDQFEFFNSSFDLGSISMRSVIFS